jgi:thymidine phosphorylase
VLDVKVGEGAFMPDPDSARALAQTMRRLGAAAGVETLCMLTGMDEPLGAAVGNALEVDEAVAMLSGHGPSDLVEVCLTAAGLLTDDRPAAERALKSGAALACYRLWVTAQGGDPDRPMERAPVVVDVPAPRAGWVSRCQARGIADVAMRLGAGRTVPGAAIDHAVGVVVHAKSGTAVEVGQPLATIHARGEVDLDAVAACFAIGDAEPQPVEPVLELL